VGAHLERLQKVLAQNFAGVNRPHSVFDHIALLGKNKSVVINNLDIVRTLSSPDKTNAPLFVDANTVPPFAVARQKLKMLSGW
jgi:hypothetical protein